MPQERSLDLTTTGKERVEKAIEEGKFTNGSLAKLSRLDSKTVKRIRERSDATDYNSIVLLFNSLKLKLNESDYEPHLPQVDPSPRRVGRIRITQATAKDIDWIGDLEYRFFKEDGVPHALLCEWHSVNSSAFWVVWNDAERIGHIDILPLKPAALKDFADGNITERGIRGTDLYGIAEKAEVTSLYVESFIIDLPTTVARAIAMHHVWLALNDIIGELCEPTRLRQICAMAATREGDKLIRGTGFEVARPAKDRVDNHPFFAFSCIEVENGDVAAALLKKDD